MVTIMAPVKYGFRVKGSAFATVCWCLPLVLFTASSQASQVRFVPELRTALYHYEIKDFTLDNKDRGSAVELAPSLVFLRDSAAMRTRLSWQHDSVFYDDNERADRSFDEFSLSHQSFFLQQRLTLSVDASQNYVIRNSRQGIFSDKITGAENLSKTQRYGTSLSYRNAPPAQYRTELDLGVSHLESARAEVDDGLGRFKNDAFNASWLIGTNQRELNLFWEFGGRIQETKRRSGNDVSSKAYAAVVGVPFAPNLSVIGRAGSERVDNSANVDNRFDYFGAGVEYRFGARSRVNVAMNRSDSTIFEQKKETDTYASGEFVLSPTRRTSLEGSFDRRYFGRTVELSGRYDIRFLSMRLRVNEAVRTQNSFDRITEELGIFVCPDGSQDLSNCFRPPSNRYVPVFGETLQEVSVVNPELREELVETRNIGLTLGYSRNRLSLNLNLDERETRYLETGDFSLNRGANMQSNWKLNEHSDLGINASFYKIDYRNESRKDENLSVSMSYQRKLSEKANLRLTLRHLDRNSTNELFDNSENRVWLEFTQRF